MFLMGTKELYEIFKSSTGVSTDSRKINSGNIFFALKGPNFNANKLANQAIESGASYAVVDDKEYAAENCILVDDCLQSLQKLARFHRDQFDIPVIGITGSNGKTTTKELIASVLETKHKVHYTKGNFNNHIGVPLTLLGMPIDSEIAIIEMGANHIGEIEELCNIANPDYGIITNIGKAHLEGFGSLEGVAKAKSELYLHILKQGKNIFYNSNDEHVSRMASRFANPISFPTKNDWCEVELVETFPTVEVEYGQELIKSCLIGAYNFSNIASAICIGKFFEVDKVDIKSGIEGFTSTNNRSQVLALETNTVILDAYNANPSSMEAALINFDDLDADSKVVILGDMFELGKTEKEEHEQIGKLLQKFAFEKVLLCGKLMQHAKNIYTEAIHFQSIEELEVYLTGNKLHKTHVLVKGSRSMGLESLFSN